MAYDIGAKLQIDGEAQFNAAIKAINGNIKALAAEMAATTSAFDENEKSIESLSAKNAVLDKQMAATREKLGTLNSEYDRQKEKLSSLGEALEKAKAEFGENSTEAGKAQNAYNRQAAACSKLEVDINNTTASLNKMSREAESNEREIGELENAADDAGDDVDELSSSADKAGKSMDDAGDKASGFAGKLKNGLAAAAKAAATAVAAATATVTAIGKESLESYSDYEQLTGGITTLFEDLNYDIVENASNAYKTAGLSANEYMETVMGFAASLNQSLVAQEGNIARAADLSDQIITDMADNANKMGTSMESIQNAYQGFAKQNYTMLDNLKLGYGGTKEEMERLLADATAISGVDYDISSFADIAEAIHVVQTELGITGTTAKEASSTIQGSISSMKSAWQNLITGFADEDADMDKLVGDVVESAVTVGENVIPRVQQILSGIGTAIQQAAPIISEQLPALIQTLLPSLLSTGTSLLTSILDGMVAAIPALVQTATTVITTLIQYLIENLPMILAAAGQIITTMISGIVEALPQLLTAGMDMLSQLASGIETGLPEMVAKLPKIIEEFLGFITENLPAILEQGVQIINSLVNGILDSIPVLVDQLPEIITSFVNFIADSLPQIVGAGIDILMNLVFGIIDAIPDLVAALPDIIMAIVSGIGKLLGSIFDIGETIVGKLVDGIGSWLSKLPETGKKLVETVKNGFTQKINDAKNWGKDLINNFIGGITEKWNALKEKVKGVAQTVKDFLGFSEPKEGPLSNFHTYAPDMMKLYAQGIAQNAKLVQGQLDKALAFDMSAADIDFRAGFRAVGRQIGSSVDELTANAVTERRRPEASGGEGRSGGEGGIDYGLLAEAIVKGLDGAGVYLAGRKVGQLVTRQQEDNARSRGVSPVPV